MPLITDLVQIRRLGEQKRKENEQYRKFLKTHGSNEKRFRRIAEDIHDQIDCTQCANCCREATVKLLERDVDHLAKFLRLKVSQFVQEYCEESEDEGLILKRNEGGCIFLDGTMCTVYESRPSTCVDFPHLIRGNGSIEFRMWQMIDRACYCPIVYNALEAYKVESGFKKP